jgi:hypothetical protein
VHHFPRQIRCEYAIRLPSTERDLPFREYPAPRGKLLDG